MEPVTTKCSDGTPARNHPPRLTIAVLGLFVGLSATAPAWSQTADASRDVKVTGPGGRTLERSSQRHVAPGSASRSVTSSTPAGVRQREVSIDRTPGSIHRDISVDRPFGSAERHVDITRGGGSREMNFEQTLRSSRPGIPMPPPVAYPSGVNINRNLTIQREIHGYGASPVIINGRGSNNDGWKTGVGVGLGVLGGMVAGAALASRPAAPMPPPPVFVTPAQPGFIAVPVQRAPAAPAMSYDQRYEMRFQDTLGRLFSSHNNSRRDGAATLGKLGDLRAVPPLVELVQRDDDAEVRIASARSLAQLGDPRAMEPLRRVSNNDRKSKVREAANLAYHHLRQMQAQIDMQAQTQAAPSTSTRVLSPDETRYLPNRNPAPPVGADPPNPYRDPVPPPPPPQPELQPSIRNVPADPGPVVIPPPPSQPSSPDPAPAPALDPPNTEPIPPAFS